MDLEANQVIEAAGGPTAFAMLIGIADRPHYQQIISNWSKRGIPKRVVVEHYDLIKRLKEQGRAVCRVSLDRKDIRAKLDPDMHEALAVLADVDGTDIGEFVERVLVEVIQRRLHDAIEIAGRAAHLGKTGTTKELPGIPSPRPRR